LPGSARRAGHNMPVTNKTVAVVVSLRVLVHENLYGGST
jgi:hypothetical protein